MPQNRASLTETMARFWAINNPLAPPPGATETDVYAAAEIAEGLASEMTDDADGNLIPTAAGAKLLASIDPATRK